MTWVSCVLWPLALLVGCPSEAPEPEPVAAPEPPPPPTYDDQRTSPPRPPLDPARDGAVYVRISGGTGSRVVALTPTGWSSVGEGSARDLHRAPDGSVWALGAAIQRLDGEERIPLPSEAPTPSRMALDASGRAWLASRDGVGRWDGQTWVSTPWSELPGAEDGTVQDLLVDPQGVVWLTTLRSIHRFDGRWTPAPLPELDIPPILGLLHATPDGAVLVSTSGGLFSREGSGWSQLDEVGATDTFDVHGPFRLHAWRKTAFRLGPDGEQRLSIPAGATHLTGVSVDGGGRVWVATDVGLHRLGEPDWWSPLGVGPLRGSIAQVVASGRGPARLPEAPALETVAVRARLLRAGTPLARTAVELCPNPRMLYPGATPCDGSALRAIGRTDADGVVTWQAARAPLQLTFQLDGEWKGVMFSDFRCCADARAESIDVGEVTLPE